MPTNFKNTWKCGGWLKDEGEEWKSLNQDKFRESNPVTMAGVDGEVIPVRVVSSNKWNLNSTSVSTLKNNIFLHLYKIDTPEKSATYFNFTIF